MAWNPDPNNPAHRLIGKHCFRPLNDLEEAAFREHAQQNDPPDTDWSLYHPVCREEWMKRGLRPEYCHTMTEAEAKALGPDGPRNPPTIPVKACPPKPKI